MTDREQFHELRKQGIGGSDVPAILGISKYRTPYELWQMKLGIRSPDAAGGAAVRGTKLEPIIADEYVEITGRRVMRSDQARNPVTPWLLCHPDRIILPERSPLHGRPERGMLEIKTRSPRLFAAMIREGLPAEYLVQELHNQAVYEMGWGDVHVKNPDSWEDRIYRVDFDAELWAEIFRRESEFWQHVIDRTPPPDGRPDPIRNIPAVGAGILRVQGSIWDKLASDLLVAEGIQSEAGRLVDSVKAQIEKLIAGTGFEGIETDTTFNGKALRYTQKAQITRGRIQGKDLMGYTSRLIRKLEAAALAGPDALAGLVSEAVKTFDSAAFYGPDSQGISAKHRWVNSKQGDKS